MNRYKFRYVFKHKNNDDLRYEYWNLDDIQYGVGNNKQNINEIIQSLKYDGYELIKRDISSGLTLDNGIDIYNNDIVEFNWSTFASDNKSICLIIYNNTERKWKMQVLGFDKAAEDWNRAKGFDLSFVIPNQFKIIGNEYQNDIN